MNVLITGADGFIGQNMAAALSKDHHVIRFVRAAVAPDDYAFDLPCHVPKIDDPIDIVIHLAAITDLALCEKNPNLAFDVNVLGTQRILEFARSKHVKKFIYVSTGGVYQSSPNPISESSPLDLDNTYVFTKFLGEQMTEHYNAYIPTVTLRYFFPYGPNNNPQRLIPRLVNSIKTNTPILVDHDGGPMLNLIYISDLIKGTMCAATSICQKRVFNIGGTESLKLRNISIKIGNILGIPPKFTFREESNNASYNSDISLAQKELNFYPKVGVEAGLKKIVV